MERFWSKVKVGEESECWPWLGSRRATGHGSFRIDGKLKSSSAIALELSGERKPAVDAQALHSCDNPPCCNPSHLRWGSSLENIRDMVDRGRSHKMPGSDNPQAKLSDDSVRAIFSQRNRVGEWGVLARVGRQYGVSYTTVRDIWQGQSWSHITGLTCSRKKRRTIDAGNR